jgi:hypothetical protein
VGTRATFVQNLRERARSAQSDVQAYGGDPRNGKPAALLEHATTGGWRWVPFGRAAVVGLASS